MSGCPAADDFKERWPALFCEAEVGESINMLPSPLGSNSIFIFHNLLLLLLLWSTVPD